MIERSIDFARPRPKWCPVCSHEWMADDAELRALSAGEVGCPSCDPSGEQNDERPEYALLRDEPLLTDDYAKSVYWYHTSTHRNWPDRNFDPAADFDEDTRRRFESSSRPGGLERWVKRQKSKALHVGTYEAAIENMLRSSRNQARAGEQFYLYRVQLPSDCRIKPGILDENQGNVVGDVQLKTVLSSTEDAYRYLNKHEDPGGVSIGLRLNVITQVQCVKIPLEGDLTASSVDDFVEAVKQAFEVTSLPTEGVIEQLKRRRGWTPPPVEESRWATAIRKVMTDRIQELPWSPGRRFEYTYKATACEENLVEIAIGFEQALRMITEPGTILQKLDELPWRGVSR